MTDIYVEELQTSLADKLDTLKLLFEAKEEVETRIDDLTAKLQVTTEYLAWDNENDQQKLIELDIENVKENIKTIALSLSKELETKHPSDFVDVQDKSVARIRYGFHQQAVAWFAENMPDDVNIPQAILNKVAKLLPNATWLIVTQEKRVVIRTQKLLGNDDKDESEGG